LEQRGLWRLPPRVIAEKFRAAKGHGRLPGDPDLRHDPNVKLRSRASKASGS
jgi:hypothetical protein